MPAAAVPGTPVNVAFTHSYNAVNQRTGQSVTDNAWIEYPSVASTTSYTANALNQYTAVGAVTPTYDANGNLLTDGTHSYTYAAENRLVSATKSGSSATYTFDARGRRQTKTVTSGATTVTTVYVTGADNRELLEYDGATGAIQRWYAYGLGPNDVVAEMNVPAGTRSTPIPDIQGSIVGTLSNAGVLTVFAYRPFGSSAAPPATFGYTGQRYDPETGSYYYRARQYSAVLGRFMQPDPIGYEAGNHLYAYVGNDPLNLIDPSGNCPWCIGAISSVAIGYGIAAVTGQSYSWKDAAVDAALGAAGVGIASKLSTAYQLSQAGARLNKARYLGALGEEAIGAGAGREGIRVGGRTLFPDIVSSNVLQEAKNVAAIGARDADQIAAYAAYSSRRVLDPVQVFVRPGTNVARIQTLIEAGTIELKLLPGITERGVKALSAGESAFLGSGIGAVNSAVRDQPQK